MPFSSISGKKFIAGLFRQYKPKTILDIGAGSGTYSKMFRRPKQSWTAVEVFEPYIEKFFLKYFYQTIILGDIRQLEIAQYEMIILGDVLEHMTADEAKIVLRNCRERSNITVISIPIGYYPQDEYDGNPYEKHITDNWTHESVIETFGNPAQHIIENEIGVYVYMKPIENWLDSNDTSICGHDKQ